ncbi:hypothetical protein [Parafrankia sp. EUN1f]|uniref:hypothetical protein n=1 Tax=Parafrankia sp. EUN1f TaxID=102897 RepID=UPI0001C45F8F|nr:hypothetical protein [Parafrankia sp. EUN1f]EFC81460.1 hypothetical protein FrEUN1fDRAFT_5403 [Parafrankia sp. EUN1f]
MTGDDRQGGSAGPTVAPARANVPQRLVVPAAAAGVLALLFLILAIVAADPSRHARGLLVVIDLVGVVGVGAVWARVSRLLSLADHPGRVE